MAKIIVPKPQFQSGTVEIEIPEYMQQFPFYIDGTYAGEELTLTLGQNGEFPLPDYVTDFSIEKDGDSFILHFAFNSEKYPNAVALLTLFPAIRPSGFSGVVCQSNKSFQTGGCRFYVSDELSYVNLPTEDFSLTGILYYILSPVI